MMDRQVIDLAAEAAHYFTTGTRPDGELFDKLADDAPEWTTDLVRHAHDDGSDFPMLPDDWRYSMTREALDTIADAGEDADADDLADGFADDADVYNADLLRWVGSHGSRAGYVDEARNEYGEPRDFYHGLQMGQYLERREVFGLVLDFLTDLAGKVDADGPATIDEAGNEAARADHSGHSSCFERYAAEAADEAAS